MKDRVVVGAIAGSYGVRGEVRLKSFCAEPADIAKYSPLTSEAGQSFDLKLGKPIKGGFAARLSGVMTKEQADALRGTRLTASREALPNLPDDEFYHADLIGLTVVDTGGVTLGQVKAVFDHGAGDILEIASKGESVLLPFTRAAVPTVDLKSQKIVADPPDGLFDSGTSQDRS